MPADGSDAAFSGFELRDFDPGANGPAIPVADPAVSLATTDRPETIAPAAGQAEPWKALKARAKREISGQSLTEVAALYAKVRPAIVQAEPPTSPPTYPYAIEDACMDKALYQPSVSLQDLIAKGRILKTFAPDFAVDPMDDLAVQLATRIACDVAGLATPADGLAG